MAFFEYRKVKKISWSKGENIAKIWQKAKRSPNFYMGENIANFEHGKMKYSYIYRE